MKSLRAVFPLLVLLASMTGCAALQKKDNIVKGEQFIACTESSCQVCNGSGRYECASCKGNKMVACGKCNGTRKVKCNGSTVMNALNTQCTGGHLKPTAGYQGKNVDTAGYVIDIQTKKRTECPNCHGSGHADCSGCRGKGEVKCSKCAGAGHLRHGKTEHFSVCENCNTRLEVGAKQCSKCKMNAQIFVCKDCGKKFNEELKECPACAKNKK